MSEKRMFIKQFWKQKRMVGAISASSRFLAEKMLSDIDFENSKVIVELGPGTGVFTDLIIKRMRKDAVLFAFELNDRFYQQLSARMEDARVHLVNDTAEKVHEYLLNAGFNKADVIISSLPLAVFPKDIRTSILNTSRESLNEDGLYIQFQYSLQAKKELERVFSKVGIKWTAFNLPPAFVYTCRM